MADRNQVATKFDCNLFGNRIKIHRPEEIISNLDALPAQSRPRVGEKAQPVTFCERL
jgi:YD repeat-containing protein